MLLQVSIVVILLASSGGTPYYIAPSDNIADNNTCFFEGRPLQPCSTLENLAATMRTISYRNIDENLTLSFLPGRYYVVKNNTYIFLSSSLSQHIILSPLIENGSAIKIKCDAEMSITFQYVRKLVVRSLEFYSCGGKNRLGHIIRVYGTMNIVQILGCSFISNSNGSAIAIHSNSLKLQIIESDFKFINSISDSIRQGVVYLSPLYEINPISFRITAFIINNTFTSNLGGAIHLMSSQRDFTLRLVIRSSSFINITSIQGAAVNIHGPVKTISTYFIDSVFYNNTATDYDGGALKLLCNSDDERNSIKITNCTFHNNAATGDGGAIDLRITRSAINVTDCIFLANECNLFGGGISIHTGHKHSKVLDLNNVTFLGNSAQTGGGMFITTIFLQDVTFKNVTFRENFATNGGAISISKTLLTIYEVMAFVNNKANFTAGALKASESRITFKGNSHAFLNNSAGRNGGALFLSKSFLYIKNGNTIFMRNNATHKGGAIFVEDFSDDCDGNHYSNCFFGHSLQDWQHTSFHYNVAEKGSILYGGLLNICGNRNGLKEMAKLSSNEITACSITSDIVNICFCDDQQRPDCSTRYKNISALRGESIRITVTTIDQQKNFKSSFIRSCDDSTLLGEGECNYNISRACTTVNFHAYSKETSGNIIIKSEGPCREVNRLEIKVLFEPCPHGFQLVLPTKDRCECDKRLAT